MSSKRIRNKDKACPGPDPRPGPGRHLGRPARRPKRFSTQVMVQAVNRDTRLPELREETISWKATQVPYLVRRAVSHRKAKAAKQARKVNR